MKIRILGCHDSDLLVEKAEGLHARRGVGMLINNTLLIYAVTATSALTIEEQQNLQCVLLSHFHIDQLKELPSLADNLLSQQGTDPLVVASIEEVLNGARTHIFNGQIFPDFFCLPSEERPTLQHRVLTSRTRNLDNRLRYYAGFCQPCGTNGRVYYSRPAFRICLQWRYLSNRRSFGR